jgi:hypothetical protein
MFALDPVVMRELSSILLATAFLVRAIWPNGVFR